EPSVDQKPPIETLQLPEEPPEPASTHGRGMRARPPPGTYRNLHNGLPPPDTTAYAQALICDFGLDPSDNELNNLDEFGDPIYDDHLPDTVYALAGSMGN